MGCGGTKIIECFCAGDFCACPVQGLGVCEGCPDCLGWCLRCGGKGRILVCLDDVCDESECAPHIDVERWCPDCSNLATAEAAETRKGDNQGVWAYFRPDIRR